MVQIGSRNSLQRGVAMDNERRLQILENLSNETGEEWTQAWRDDLTPEELDFVAQEDRRYCNVVQAVCTVILIRERVRQRFQPQEIEELTTIHDHCRLRLRDGRMFLARLALDGSLILDEIEEVC